MKKKTFYSMFAKFCLWSFLGLFVIGAIWIDSSFSTTCFICGAILGLLGCVFHIKKDFLEEDDSPTNLRLIEQAIIHVAEVQQGTKDELVEKFSVEMYDLLLNAGIIHQIRDERIPEGTWEVTLRGQRKANGF